MVSPGPQLSLAIATVGGRSLVWRRNGEQEFPYSVKEKKEERDVGFLSHERRRRKNKEKRKKKRKRKRKEKKRINK